MDRLAKILINKDSKIRAAMKQLNANASQILVVVDEGKRLFGTVTDGDIRRALLQNMKLDNSVSRITNRKPRYLFEEEKDRSLDIMRKFLVAHIPILNTERRVVDVVSIRDLDKAGDLRRFRKKNNTVFILAGGKGARLDPFTKILPKPLIPINDKPIIEVIMENFRKYGFSKFVLSLNYKGPMIKMYFSDNPQNFDIEYVDEKSFLGTAGSLSLVKGKISKTFLVSNCDIIINVSYDELFDFHIKEKNDFTLVGIMRHMRIPYGVVTMKNRALVDMIEKPEYDFIVNAGTYVMEPRLLKLINKNENIDMPDLIKRVKSAGYRVGVFPASADWVDIGEWEEYKVALDHFNDTVHA